MSDKINAKEFVRGYAQPKNYVKAFIYGTIFLMIVGAGFAVVYTVRSLFADKTQSNQLDLRGSKDANVTIVQKDKRVLIPFVEGGFEQRWNEKMGTYIRAGVRFEL